MDHTHTYTLNNTWTGNTGNGTAAVRGYERSHTVSIAGKPDQHLTTDNPLVGDKTRLNPEDLLVTALSSCHLMSYLYLCALEGLVVTAYEDKATGIMIEKSLGGGSFSEVTLRPAVTIADATQKERAIELHRKAHDICYIANSVNFPVYCVPEIRTL